MAGFTVHLALLLFSSACVIVVVHSDATPPPIFVFGDSLADVGNNNKLPNGVRADHPPYGIDFPGGVATGRFSNGYNFIDVLAQQMGHQQSPPPAYTIDLAVMSDEYIKRGLNFASGGSGILTDCGSDEVTAKCYSLSGQIKSFASFVSSLSAELGATKARELIAKSIFLISTGYQDVSTDLLHQLLTNPLFPGEVFVSNMTTTFGTHLKELYSLGARKFGILRIPLGGVSPVARAVAVSSPQGLLVFSVLNAYSLQIDVGISTLLRLLSLTQLREMKYSLFNTYAVSEDAFNHTAEFGWKNAKSPCCGEVRAIQDYPYAEVVGCTAGAPLCSNHDEYVFWDSLNPTQSLHQYVGKRYYDGNVPLYAYPMNLKQLVEYGSWGTGEHKTLEDGVVAGGGGRSAAI